MEVVFAYKMMARKAHLLWEDGEKYVRLFSGRLDATRAAYVQKVEKAIKFGNPHGGIWHDIEADEVDLFKEEVGSAVQTKRARWHQWAGIVQRGVPSSLVLFPTTPKRTIFKSPGPGPITVC